MHIRHLLAYCAAYLFSSGMVWGVLRFSQDSVVLWKLSEWLHSNIQGHVSYTKLGHAFASCTLPRSGKKMTFKINGTQYN